MSATVRAACVSCPAFSCFLEDKPELVEYLGVVWVVCDIQQCLLPVSTLISKRLSVSTFVSKRLN